MPLFLHVSATVTVNADAVFLRSDSSVFQRSDSNEPTIADIPEDTESVCSFDDRVRTIMITTLLLTFKCFNENWFDIFLKL